MSEPFDPELTIIRKRLFLLRLLRPILPDCSVALLSKLLTLVSNSIILDAAVLFLKVPKWTWSMTDCTSIFWSVITCMISMAVFLSATKSLTPTLNELDFIYSVTTFCKSSMKLDAAIFPKSLHTRWMIPLVPEPNTDFSIWPRRYCPLRISITLLVISISSPSSNNLVLYFRVRGGRICDNTSKLDTISPASFNLAISTLLYIINKFMASLWDIFILGLVKRYDPNMESW